MKTKLNEEQTNTLVKLRLAGKISFIKLTLDELIELLQEELESVEEKGAAHPLYMIYQNKKWSVYYGDYIGLQTADELIDAVYNLVIWRVNNYCL